MTKRALVLSGGGSKGAYEVGVMLALKKLNIEYQIVTGTSVGALNGLFAVQKDIYQAYNLWKSIGFSTIYNEDLFKKVGGNSFEIYKKYAKTIVKDGGIEVSGLESNLNRLFSPSKFYGSKIEYGLVTYNLTKKKPVYLTKKDLPQEKIKDYVIASATCFPAFKPKEIDGDLYIDGGYHDNLPINLALELGNKKLREFYNNLGFGKKTGIELPGEESGIIRLTYESELASASFGQGITITPIQMLQALTTITNDGVMIKPYIVDKIVDEKGNITYEGKREELGRKVSSESIKKIKELMYDVVYNGVTKIWQCNNITIGGKTGTAQIASPNGGYLTGNTNFIRSFAGIFPYEDPEYIFYVTVKQIDNGANALAKVVTKAIESIANYAHLVETETNLDKDKVIKLDNYLSNDIKTAVNILEKNNLKPVVIGKGNYVINQYPLNKTEVLQKSKVFLLTESNEYIMPDIKGWSSSEVLSFCNLIGLNCKFQGYGVVDTYNIEKDTIIDLKKTLEVTLKTT